MRSRMHYTLITLAIGLFCMVKQIPNRGLTTASYRRTNVRQAQPDLSYYLNEHVQTLPEGNQAVDLDIYPAPDWVVEIAATSFSDDLGNQRLLYEALGVKEYWVVDIKNSQIIAFEVYDRGSKRIMTSMVLPGLAMSTLEKALRDRTTQDDSQIMVALMQQFQAA